MANIGKRSLQVDLYNADPSAPTVTPTGGASGHFTYKLVGRTANGNHTAASTGTAITDGPTTLDGTHYNTIDPTGITAPGVATWDVYRTAGGATQGLIGNIANDGATTLDDKALVGDASTAPATNTTGIGGALAIDRFSHTTVYLNGAITGTVQLQLSTDAGATWNDEGSALTNVGVVDITKLADFVRAKCTAYTSGNFTLDARGLDRE